MTEIEFKLVSIWSGSQRSKPGADKTAKEGTSEGKSDSNLITTDKKPPYSVKL